MRARNIKPSFFKNELLADVAPLGRILFAGLWCAADRKGRLDDRPRKWKAEILPYDDCDVDELLDELDLRGFILRYEVSGVRYIQVVNFARHQNPHKAERPSIIPAPCESGACTIQAQFSHSASTVQAPESSEQVSEIPEVVGLIPDSGLLIPDCGVDNTTTSGGVVASHPSGFDDFWNVYPRKVGLKDAKAAWAKLRGVTHEAILDAVCRAKASVEWQREGGRFIPHPSTFLNRERWTDDVVPAAYTQEQVAVFEAYNSVLGAKEWPPAKLDPFSPDRAAAISQFLTFNEKPNWVRSYFDYLAVNLAARAGYGLDWTLRRDIYLRAREANFSNGGANVQ